ncbi:MAG: endonuclease III domain-containing protein [Magnetococcales bacterium]|nr:endonuclease III domain-containing protein [Magnetococcales bacterium]MBF0116382.1 endonuclease III domain-containing protein [Magnetococcales bacterium]
MRRLYDTLFATYGPQHWWPADSLPELMIGAILVQNTAWQQVEQVIQNLKQADHLSLADIRHLPAETWWHWLRPVGFFRVKYQRLKAFADFMALYDDQPERLFRQETQPLRQTLLAIPGIGKETADAILCYGAQRPIFVVDTYAQRLFARLEWCTATASYDTIQARVHAALPADWVILGELHALIVQHGKNHCRKQAHCPGCPLHFCPAWKRDGR